ncbi:MAG: hpch/hpai aldolase [Paenibacillus sp.]|jgi:2-dehydro-3-deoxyglucarate aldolase/4-hydroxy-2-oxoheptanedioate aldolase|nr:hpch/hpai aldolase [Paenibacillus sp.]
MRPNAVKRKLYDGGTSFGTFVMEFGTPGIAAILEQSGAEFAVYDMEHSIFGTDTIRQIMSYNRGLSIVPIVRVPDTQYHFMARALDAGAKGIMVPMVESGQQAETIIQACKYAPLGNRGTTTNIAHDDFNGGNLAESLQSANKETFIIAQIETEAGVNHIEDIISTEGIDVAWVGHNDLSVSMGIPGQVNHPRVIEAMEHVANACRKHGKIAGRLVPDIQTGIAWLDKGYRCLAYSNDIRLLQSALKQGIVELTSHSSQ